VNSDLKKKLTNKNFKSIVDILNNIDESVSLILMPIKYFDLFYPPHQNVHRIRVIACRG